MKLYLSILLMPFIMHSFIIASSQPGIQSYNGFNYWNVGPYGSVFCDEIVGERYDCLSINFQYGISIADVAITTSGTGTTSSSNSIAVVSTGSTANSLSLVQSTRDIIYNAGHEAHALFSCIFFNGGVAGSTQWIGAFNNADGFAVGFNGTQFSILYLNNATSTIIPISSFNSDRLDGTGPSRFVYDPTTLNVFRIAYGWLSSSVVLFQVLGQNGYFVTFHTLSLMNTSISTSLSNPSLPISMQVTNPNTTTNISMGSAAWSGSTVQRKTIANIVPQRLYITSNGFVTNATGETILFAIRNNTTFNNVPNGVMDYFQTVQLMPFSTTPAILLLVIRKNPTITNASYTGNFSQSPNQFTTTGTISGGTLLATLPFSYYAATNTLMPVALGDKGAPVVINPGDVISFSVQNFSGATSIGLIFEVAFQEVH